MKYASGEVVLLGDKVDLGGQRFGNVVGVIQEARYASDYRHADWAYLGHGLLIRTEFGDLRIEEPDEDTQLVARQRSVA